MNILLEVKTIGLRRGNEVTLEDGEGMEPDLQKSGFGHRLYEQTLRNGETQGKSFE